MDVYIQALTTALFIMGQARPTDHLPDTAATQACESAEAGDYPKADIRISTHTAFARSHYPERVREFASEPLHCGDIVMLGDSLTEKHDWTGLFDRRTPIQNRGIAGDTSDGLVARLGEVVKARPSAVFILIGTNDLWSKNSPHKTVDNITVVVRAIRGANPATPIFVQTVPPVRSEPQLNAKIARINALLATSAATVQFSLIDLHSVLSGSDGLLRSDYTVDGVHLTPLGYSRWEQLLGGLLCGQADAASLTAEYPRSRVC